MFSSYPDVVTVNQVCKMLRLGRASVYALLQDKTLSHVRVGRKYVIPKLSVIGFVSQVCYNDAQIINDGLQSVKKEMA